MHLKVHVFEVLRDKKKTTLQVLAFIKLEAQKGT